MYEKNALVYQYGRIFLAVYSYFFAHLLPFQIFALSMALEIKSSPYDIFSVTRCNRWVFIYPQVQSR